MNKYRFECFGDTNVTMVTDALTWDELMDQFVYFLRGCGFYVKDGEWVENDTGTETDNS